MNFDFKPGVKPNDPSKARLYYRMFKTATAVPATVDYSGFTPNDVLGNDIYGCCVFSSAGHTVVEQTFYGQGSSYVVSEQQVLAAYSQVTGFSPSDPASDQGATLQEGLQYLNKYGFGGHKIAAYAQVDIKNVAELKSAVAEFGAVSLALDFPASAMDDFNAGRPWDVHANDGGIEGGHAVLMTGYTDAYVTVQTWGRPQKVSYAFLNKYFVESWAVISPDWWNAATGLDPEGVDLAALGAQWSSLTGQSNPFPTVPPVDPPVDPPVGPDAAELALIRAAARYEDSSRPKQYLVAALNAWEKDKGYS
jgi:hypothetical protein